eukprot:CAMPEP_0180086142 /NCGR_PEP_ID=MMETSP0985-20121206/20885_1 /TAXON_ID=483367 /ORGANISM="non described non described, Strain CCMP 2436" /LENGTH=293 /DNA_ID=CAMNT_0022020147 /DNA_START=310 /DNA_END=1192 /DNA_ORIENTATION=-
MPNCMATFMRDTCMIGNAVGGKVIALRWAILCCICSSKNVAYAHARGRRWELALERLEERVELLVREHLRDAAFRRRVRCVEVEEYQHLLLAHVLPLQLPLDQVAAFAEPLAHEIALGASWLVRLAPISRQPRAHALVRGPVRLLALATATVRFEVAPRTSLQHTAPLGAELLAAVCRLRRKSESSALPLLLPDTASVRDGVVHGGGGGEEVENRQQRARGPERAAALSARFASALDSPSSSKTEFPTLAAASKLLAQRSSKANDQVAHFSPASSTTLLREKLASCLSVSLLT